MQRHNRRTKRATSQTKRTAICPMCKGQFQFRPHKLTCSDRCKKRRLRLKQLFHKTLKSQGPFNNSSVAFEQLLKRDPTLIDGLNSLK